MSLEDPYAILGSVDFTLNNPQHLLNLAAACTVSETSPESLPITAKDGFCRVFDMESALSEAETTTLDLSLKTLPVFVKMKFAESRILGAVRLELNRRG
jgi:hypothetical protein